jgi:hypothetical protein
MLDFSSLEPRKVEFAYGSKQYELREADGEAVRVWRNAIMQGAKFDPGTGQPVAIGSMADGEVALLSHCVYCGGKLVPAVELKRWPGRILKALYDRCQEISELEERPPPDAIKERIDKLQKLLAESEQAKNGTSSTPDGSSTPSVTGSTSTSASAGPGR